MGIAVPRGATINATLSSEPQNLTIAPGDRIVTLSWDVPIELLAVQQLNTQAMQFQDDAPACDVCGAITVRNGTCYKCFNCGNSMGCS